jgi:thiamine-phosphate pyrophosphorylase
MMAPDLRLIVVTDAELAAPRTVLEIVAACLAAGAPAIQLRDKRATARELHEQSCALLALTRPAGARLFVNDRLDVALAAGADGVHLGPADLPVAAAVAAAPRGFLVGFSTDDEAAAVKAAADGAAYIGCGAVYGTSTKTEVGDERIGPDGVAAVVAAVSVPVIGIGGIRPGNAAAVRRAGAAGVAVVGAVMRAAEPAAVVAALLAEMG